MMAAIVSSVPDTLNEQVRRFAQTPLRQSAFLNGVPKCGTHLLRNVVRMFVPVEQHYDREFIQIPNLQQHMAALDAARPQFSVGHMLFADISVTALRRARHVILVRDPYDYVLARTRFSLSDQFNHPHLNHLKGGAVSVEEMLNMMIFGIPGKGPALREVFMFHAVAWMGTGAALVRYEDILENLGRLQSPEAEAYFSALLGGFGIGPLPQDWRERVRIGSDRAHSATARERLSGGMSVPAELPEMQKQLVEHAAPGLRSLLGYA
jgi:hypothetical protein